MSKSPTITDAACAPRPRVEIEPGPSPAEFDAWYAARERAVRRALHAAEAAARRNRVHGPIDLLGKPLDRSPAGRRKAECAAYLATGYPPCHPAEYDDPPDEKMERLEDEWWADPDERFSPAWWRLHAPIVRRRQSW